MFVVAAVASATCGAIPLYNDSSPNLSLSVPSNVNLSVAPLTGSAQDSETTTAVASTNASKGYRLTLRTTTQDTCLKHQTQLSTPCSAITNNLKYSNLSSASPSLGSGTWGVSLDGGSLWQAVPDSSDALGLLLKNTSTASQDNVDIDVGVSSSYSHSDGAYVGNITYTLVANMMPQPVLTDINPSFGITGKMITINGQNLDTAYEILIENVSCVIASIESSAQLTCVLPSDGGQFQDGEKLDITVKTWGGEDTLKDALEWSNASGTAPVITDLNKNKQPFIDQFANDNSSASSYLLSLVTASDLEDDANGVPLNLTIDNDGGFNIGQVGEYSVTYKVVDSDGNVATYITTVEVWNFIKIVNGQYHVVTLGSNGTVWTFGYNNYGQRGQGNTNAANTLAGGAPTVVNQAHFGGARITDIAAGHHTSCALTDAGVAYCWGYGLSGNLGNGSASSSSNPVAVNMPSGVTFNEISGAKGTDTSAGFAAVGSDGNVYTWGNGAGFRLGNGSTTNQQSPFKITSVGDIVTAYQGNTGGVAADSLGQVYVWGANNQGQLAYGNTTAANATTSQPHLVNNVSDVVEVSYGGYGPNGFVLARNSGGNVYHWGWNYGRNGTGSDTLNPSLIGGISGVRHISAGPDYSHFTVNNDLYTVGYVNSGEGFRGNTTLITTPSIATVANIPNNVSMSSSAFDNAYVLSKDGKIVYSIGYSNATDRELGSTTVAGTTTNSAVPWSFTPPAL